MFEVNNGSITASRTRRSDRRDYRWLLGLAVACFFVVSVVTRCLPRGLRPFAASGPARESCIAEARRMALAVIPYAFEW